MRNRRGWLIFVLIGPMLFMTGFGISLVIYTVPYTSYDAEYHAVENTSYAGVPLYWYCPVPEGGYTSQRLDLGITEDEFRDSMERDVLRVSTIFIPTYMTLVEPNDRYVLKVAEYLTDITEGYDKYLKAKTVMNFVQTAIRYDLDEYIYGCDEFPALPLETLYLRRGDCEDTAILLMSIYLAMGYDTVLFDFPEHYAVGVRWNGQDDYLYCESSSDRAVDFGYGAWDSDEILDIYGYDVNEVARDIHTAIAWYRNTIKRTIGF